MNLDHDLHDYLAIEAMSLGGLLTSGRVMWLPWEQRAYAWEEDNVRRLMSDLVEAFQSRSQRYLLGHLMLSREKSNGSFAIVDGQQRLITLSLMFAALHQRMVDQPTSAALAQCLFLGEDTSEPVLRVQSGLRREYERSISKRGRDEAGNAGTVLSESEQKLVLNRALIEAALRDNGIEGARAVEFARFLLRRCLVVRQVVEDRHEAQRLLATAEQTGLEFHCADRAKVSMISAMPRAEQDEAGRVWEDCQARLGSDGMSQLLEAILVMQAGQAWKGRTKTPIETDLAVRFQIDQSGLVFVRQYLARFTDVAVDLRERLCRTQRQMRAGLPAGDRIDAALVRLDWIADPVWWPAVLTWIAERGFDDQATPAFFDKLERSVWLHRIAGVDPLKRSQRFAEVVVDIADGRSLDQLRHLSGEHAIAAAARDALMGRTFYYKPFAWAVLRRVSMLLGKDPGPRDGQNVTIEHILPRKPKPGSQWLDSFGGQQGVARSSERLGNFAVLTQRENQAAGNQNWSAKRVVLQASQSALSQEALLWGDWSAAVIDARSQKLADLVISDLMDSRAV